jgi:hypothetical protein
MMLTHVRVQAIARHVGIGAGAGSGGGGNSGVRRARLVVLGNAAAGKTALVRALLSNDSAKQTAAASAQGADDDGAFIPATGGGDDDAPLPPLDIVDWSLTHDARAVKFSVWDVPDTDVRWLRAVALLCAAVDKRDRRTARCWVCAWHRRRSWCSCSTFARPSTSLCRGGWLRCRFADVSRVRLLTHIALDDREQGDDCAGGDARRRERVHSSAPGAHVGGHQSALRGAQHTRHSLRLVRVHARHRRTARASVRTRACDTR